MRHSSLLPLLLMIGCSGGSGGSSDAVDPLADADVDTSSVAADTGVVADDTGTAAEVTTDVESPSDTASDTPSDSGKETATDAAVTGSPGCGKAATPGVTNGTIKVGTLDRTYVLSIPTGYSPTKPLPLLFAWHGRTGSGTGFRSGGDSYGGGVEKASAGKGIFIYPNGLPVTSDPKDTGWVDGDPKGRDFAMFDALLTDLSNKLCVDSKRVFSYGHSFGGYMSNALGCHRSAVIRGIAPVASGGPFGTCDGGAVAAYISSAKDDPIVTYSQGTGTRDKWIKANGCDATKTTPLTPAGCVSYGGCKAGEPVTFCGTDTGGHSFPSYTYDGIWGFFAALP